MIRRYTLPEMGAIWTEQARFEEMLRVEIAVARAQAARGLVPAAALWRDRGARPGRRRPDRRDRADDRPRRDRLRQPGRRDGRAGGPLPPPRPDQQRRRRHRPGAPAAGGRRAPAARLRPAARGARRPGPGRGRHGDDGPDPLGPRRADHVRPEDRRLGVRARPRPDAPGRAPSTRSRPARSRARSGTYSHLEPDLEAEVLADLGLHVDPVSTQIVQRDRHAALLAAIAITGGSLERFATEIRNLQHTEIGELQEPFRAGQKGSSAMPHKRNPILSERIAGLARLLRGYAGAALENQPLWHERDISHSQRRAGAPARRDDPARLHAGQDDRPGRAGWSSGPSGCARTSSAASGCTRAAGCWSPWSRTPDCRARTPTPIVQRRALRAADERRPLRELLATEPTVAARLSLGPARRVLRRRHVPAPRADGRSPGSIGSMPPDAAPRCRRRSRPCSTGPAAGRRSSMPLAESFLRSGKVRDLYDDRRRHACCSSPPIGCRPSTWSCRRAIPDKGRVLTGLSRFWFAETAGIVPNHLARLAGGPAAGSIVTESLDPVGPGPATPATRRRAARPDHDLPPGPGPAGRGDRPRLPGRLGLEGLPADRRGLRDQRCRPACARAIACRSRSSRRRPRPSSAPTTRTSRSTR